MTESKKVTEVKTKTSEIPTRDEELHSEDIPFLRGGLQNGVRPRELDTAPLLSPHTLPILLSGLHLAWDSSPLQMVCAEMRGGGSLL